MEADSLEGVTDGPANALSREQRDRGAIEDIDDSEAEDLDGSAGPVAGTEPSKAVKTYGLQTPESAKDGTAATATAEDENQKAARQLVHGQTGTDGFALPYTGPDKDEERRDDADPDPSKTRRRPFKRAGTRYAAKKRMRDAVDLIEVQFLNAPEVPTEIIVEAYDQGVITKDAFRHIYCLAAGFKEWQMLPIEEDSPADVRDQEASELAWKAEETRAAGGAGGGGKPGGRGVKRPASKAGGSAAKRSKPSGR
jgi:hypothetical protein